MTRNLRQCDIDRLHDIGQFRLMTAEMLHRRRFAGSEVAAAESWLKRQRTRRLLATEPLDERRVYFRLTATAVRRLREERRTVSRAAARPLKPMTKIQRYALLAYCTPSAGTLRHVYRPSQDAVRFPEVAAHIASGKADPLRSKMFYREGDLIGWLLVDRGWARALDRKVKPKAVSLSRWESLWQQMETGRFRLTIVVVTDSRREELLEEFQRDPPEFPWEVVLIPEVARVLPRHRQPQNFSSNS